MSASSAMKDYTVSLPVDLARTAESLAKQESRTVNELFQEAVRTYSRLRSESVPAEPGELFAEYNPYNPMGYTEEDVPRLIKEWRAEQNAKAKSRE